MNEPHVAASLVRQLVDTLVARGLDRAELVARAGASAEALRLDGLRLPCSLLERLFETAEVLGDDDRIGLHAAELPPLDVTGWAAMLLVASGTLREAGHQASRFTHLWSTALQLRATEGAGSVRCELELRRPASRGLVHLREWWMAQAVLLARHLCRRAVDLREVRFTHPRRGDLAEYEAFFGAPVRFEAGGTGLTASSEGLDDPLPTASRPLFELFERKATEELSELSRAQPLRERVRSMLEEELEVEGLAAASLAGAARRLRTSARTLQRALRDEGTSYANELEGVRRRAAARLLLAGADIAEVSWRLGYAEPPVFHRAFKRWTGQTPERFRRTQRDPGSGAVLPLAGRRPREDILAAPPRCSAGPRTTSSASSAARPRR